MQLHERLDAVIRWLGIALVGLLPFFVIPTPWITVTAAKIMLTGSVLLVIAVLWLIARFIDGEMRVPWHFALLAVLLVPATYLLSAGITGFSSASLIGSGTDNDTVALIALGCLSLCIYAGIFTMHPRAISHALRALLSGSLVLLLLQAVHLFFPSFSLGGVLAGQTGNAFGTWREFAMLAGVLFFLSVSLDKTPVTRGLWRYIVWLVAVLSGCFVIITNHSDVIALVFIAFLMLLFARGYRMRALGTIAFWKHQYLAALIAVIAGILLVFGSQVTQALPEPLRVVQTDVRPSWKGTFAIAQQSLAKPTTLIFGAGPNTFTREWGLHKPIAVNQTPFWNTDFSVGVASIPTSLITVGILGALAWVLLILSAVWLILRTWFSSADSPVLSIGVPLSIALFYLIALQMFTIPGSGLTMLMCLMLGMYVALLVPVYVSEATISLKGTVWGWATCFFVCILTAALVYTGGALVRVTYAEALINRSVLAYNETKNIEQSSQYVLRALMVYSKADRAHRTAVQFGFLSLQELMASPDAETGARERLQQTLKDTIQHGLDAVSINSNNYQNWLLLASLYTQLAGSNIPGAYEKARDAYEQALVENPTSPLPYVNMAQLEILQGNAGAAKEHLRKAIELKPDLAAAHYLLSQVLASEQDHQNALQSALNAANFASGDAEAWYNLGAIAYAAQDYPDAIMSLKQALVIQPQFANAMYVLGLAYYQSGDQQSALAQFEALNALDPGQELVQQILTDLQEGKAPRVLGAQGATSTPMVR